MSQASNNQECNKAGGTTFQSIPIQKSVPRILVNKYNSPSGKKGAAVQKKYVQKHKNNDNKFKVKYLTDHGQFTIDKFPVIIIPYRDNQLQNREEQLKILIPLLYNLFDEQKYTNYVILVIEQTEDKQKFNRGKLCNIGAKIAKERFPGSYCIFHDVDLYPSRELFLYYMTFPIKPMHMHGGSKKYPEQKGRPHFMFGGVVSMSEESLIKSNGFPNNYWGWGGEDDELRRRVFRTHNIIWRPNRKHSAIEEPEHIWDPKDGTPKQERIALAKKNISTWQLNGLANLTFNIYQENDLSGLIEDRNIDEEQKCSASQKYITISKISVEI